MVFATRLWKVCPDLPVTQGTAKRDDSTYKPRQDDVSASRAHAHNKASRGEDARADHVGNDDGGSRKKGKDSTVSIGHASDFNSMLPSSLFSLSFHGKRNLQGMSRVNFRIGRSILTEMKGCFRKSGTG